MTGLPAGFITQPIAHRGLHDSSKGIIEASQSAFAAAISHGYAIEFDLQLSREGQAIVFHDYHVDRLTEKSGSVEQFTEAELSKIRLTGSQDTIKSLPEVLKFVAGRAPLLIELKDQDGAMGLNIGRLEWATAKALSGYLGPVAVMSYNPHSVAKLAELAPDVPRGYTVAEFGENDWSHLPASLRKKLAAVPDFEKTGACFISQEASGLNAPRVLELKSKGASILCWTIRSPEEEAEARKIADNVTFEGYLAKQD